MSFGILYPKPLPKLIKETQPLESGFTPTEVVALQNGWRLIKRRFSYHSSKIFIDFFSENFLLLHRFRNSKTGKFNLNSLYQHPNQLMNVYGQLIESGLNDLSFINTLLCEISQRHQFYGVTYEEIKLQTDYIVQYFINFFDKITTSTFVNGFNKLSELINGYHRESNENEETLSNQESDIFDQNE